jgi:hypothetical protein
LLFGLPWLSWVGVFDDAVAIHHHIFAQIDGAPAGLAARRFTGRALNVAHRSCQRPERAAPASNSGPVILLGRPRTLFCRHVLPPSLSLKEMRPMHRKPASKVQMIWNGETDAQRLLYVRRIVAEWVARIAIPKPARRKRVAKRVAATRGMPS